MMRRLLLQVNIPIIDPNKEPNSTVHISKVGNKSFRYREDLYKLSEQQARKYAINCGADYIQITDCSFLPNKHPIYQRLKMFEMDEYEQILYLDSDAIVLDRAPSIFDLYGNFPISAIPDIPLEYDKSKYYRKVRQQVNSVLGAPEDYRSFTSGIFLVNREFLNDAKHIYSQYLNTFEFKGAHDQGLLNKCVLDIGKGYNMLPPDWGALNLRRTAKYIIHIWGFHKDGFNLERYCKRLKLKNPYNTEKDE